MKITDGYHNLSHHGRNESKLAQLDAIDKWHMKLLGGMLGKLKGAIEKAVNRCSTAHGAVWQQLRRCQQAHDQRIMPVILAGGGFRHGQHLAFDTERNYPLPNLFVSMLQRMGIESDKFASSTGTMRGLELSRA